MYLYVCVCAYVWVWIFMFIFIYSIIFVYTFVYASICLCVCMLVRLRICVYGGGYGSEMTIKSLQKGLDFTWSPKYKFESIQPKEIKPLRRKVLLEVKDNEKTFDVIGNSMLNRKPGIKLRSVLKTKCEYELDGQANLPTPFEERRWKYRVEIIFYRNGKING